jgi:hypothetical protein
VDLKISRFKEKWCRNYEELGLIFDWSTATGIFRQSSAQSPPDTDEEAHLMHRMQTEGIHVYDGGVGRRGQPEGYPSLTLVDLGSPHDEDISGPSFVRGRRSGKQSMVEDTRGRGNAPARGIGLGVSMGSSGKGSSGKKSSRETKATVNVSKQAMYDEMRELAKAIRESIQQQTQQDLSSTQQFNTAKFAPPINQAITVLNELQAEITLDTYVATSIALLDEKLQNLFLLWNKEHRLLWLSKVKPLD